MVSGRSKLVTLLRHRDGSVEEFHRRLLEVAADRALVDNEGMVCLSLSLCDVPFEEVALDERLRAPYDAVLERYPVGRAKPRALADPAGLLGHQHTYLVEEHCIKPGAVGPATWPTPGVKCIYAVRRREGLTREEYWRHWRLVHAELAVRHHVGMDRYVQDHIRDASEGAPTLDGIASLHFPSYADRRERAIDSPHGREVIDADTSVFVGETAAMAATEYRYES